MGFRTPEDVLGGADLWQKTAIITGGSRGPGKETARALAKAGARVILTCRDAGSQAGLMAELQADKPRGLIVVEPLDLADLASIRAFADKVAWEDRIDFVICNAAVAPCPLLLTRDGFAKPMGVNHIGHAYLMQLLEPKMRDQGFLSRIVVVTSAAHESASVNDLHYRNVSRKYSKQRADAETKLANILFAKQLALRNQNIKVFSVNPGIVTSSHSIRSLAKCGCFGELLMRPFRSTVQQGVASIVFAATSPELEQSSGAYILKCRVAQPSAKARDMELAARLWEATNTEIETALKANSSRPRRTSNSTVRMPR